ncbi:unnamed protein product [Phytophthora fragariaefolia]|uniref:Unnamed protein product n=1 Tax=Phytophthora fragariaefolia TaxID=1490495 RepID=A0A9W7CYG3_9STRA|nr:unnamed protein product [Phytophthora fragariaefolia]
MTEPPSVVRQAVEEFQALGRFELVPPQPKETSYIFKWGVRVTYVENGKEVFVWTCLADEACRTSEKNLLKLYAGKTTMAVKHLQKIHNVGSPKTETATVKKLKYDHDYSHLSSSVLYSNNPIRLNVLMTTLMIINHSLAFRMVEYEEARLMQVLLYKDEMKATITTKQTKKAIVELYSSTRKEIINYLLENREDYPNLTLVADFWTCRATQDKFLGLRVYLVGKAWQYKSILLGTRRFNPAYGDRDGGIATPFKGWLKHMLGDFSLGTSDFYGATSDSGGGVT